MEDTQEERRSGRLGNGFERVLWSSRLLVLVAVVAALLLAVAALVVATVDVVGVINLVSQYVGRTLDAEQAGEVRTAAITGIIKALDGYLIAALLVVVSLGLYELFVNPIGPARGTVSGYQLLRVRDLEDLKQRVGKLIILVLVVEFAQQSLRFQVETGLDLLYQALGVLLVSGALFLTARGLGGKSRRNGNAGDPASGGRTTGTSDQAG